MTGFVYAISCGDRVKIGWSADPIARLGKIQADNAGICSLIGAALGSLDDEAAAHRALAPWLVRGEWFDYEATEVRDFCCQLPAMRPRRIADLSGRTPLEGIRRAVFGVSQAEFASIARVSQPTVSRWEARETLPTLHDLSLVRDAAKDLGHSWSDSWFFDGVPASLFATERRSAA